MKKNLLVMILGFVLLFSAAACYLLLTTNGSKIGVKFLLSRQLKTRKIEIEKTEGNLIKTLILSNLTIRDLNDLPFGSVLKIQKLDIKIVASSADMISVKADNARLMLPDQEPTVFCGSYQNGLLDFSLYFKCLNIQDAFGLYGRLPELKNVSGTISDADIYIKGPMSAVRFSGTFNLPELLRNKFSLKNCSVIFDLTLKDDSQVFGEVVLNNGELSGFKTAVVKLGPSKILFSGDPKAPMLNLKGESTVEGVKIETNLKGTMDKPDLRLKSQPPMAQEWLLIALATGKSWRVSEARLNQGKIPITLASDFLDYFIFSGSASKVAQQLGISDFSLTYEDQTKGLGGEYKINASTSIEAEKELKQEDKTDIKTEAQTNNKVMLKYKKEF